MAVLPFSTSTYGSGCVGSISHLRFTIFHSWIISGDLCFSKSLQASSHRFAMSRASRKFFNSSGPSKSHQWLLSDGSGYRAKLTKPDDLPPIPAAPMPIER